MPGTRYESTHLGQDFLIPRARNQLFRFRAGAPPSLYRGMVDEAVPCPFAKEIDALQVPPRKESCVLYRWRRSLRRTCAHRRGRPFGRWSVWTLRAPCSIRRLHRSHDRSLGGDQRNEMPLAARRRVAEMCRGGLGTTAPGLIGTMIFQLAIPRQVALPQSLPPLHQPRHILQELVQAVIAANGKPSLNSVSHPRGQPQLLEELEKSASLGPEYFGRFYPWAKMINSISN